MRITIITACYNSIATIRDAMESVWRQIGVGDRCERDELPCRNGERVDGCVGVGLPCRNGERVDGCVGVGLPCRNGERVELEYIVVDGGSTDGTVDVIKEFGEKIRSNENVRRKKEEGRSAEFFSFKWVSERDHGLYDALNKGIKMATGDVIGICNADDVLASDDVIAKVAEGFKPCRNVERVERVDAIYADIRFVRDNVSCAAGPHTASSTSLHLYTAKNSPNPTDLNHLRSLPTVRYCTGKYFRKWMFRFATFPAHPSTFVRRECFEKFGLYSLDYPICADFEMMLRLFVKHNIATRYLPLCTHIMRMGGASTGGLRSNIAINNQDLRALRAHGVWSCLPLIYLKYFAKVWGFVKKEK